MALEDVQENELLFAIPRRAVLCTSTSSLSKTLPHLFSDIDDWIALILIMIHEYFLGSASVWKPYFDVLPMSFDTPMFWSKDEVAQLQASALVAKIGKIDADAQFRSDLLPLIRMNEKYILASGSRHLTDDELLKVAHRMASTIMAYAFDIECRGDEACRNDSDSSDVMEEDEDAILAKVLRV